MCTRGKSFGFWRHELRFWRESYRGQSKPDILTLNTYAFDDTICNNMADVYRSVFSLTSITGWVG